MAMPQEPPAREIRSHRGFACRLRNADGLLLQITLGKPVFEPDLSEPGVAFRNERSLFYGDAVVAGRRVGNHFARILSSSKTQPDEFIETKLFRTAYFNRAIHRRACCDLAQRARYLVG